MIVGETKVVGLPTEPAEATKQFGLEDVDPLGRTEVMIYGPPGCGKTVMAATFPPPFRWLDADGGLKSLRWAHQAGRTSLTSLGRDQLTAYRPDEELDGWYPKNPAAFDKACDMIAHWFSPTEVDKWQTLVIDSATTLDQWAIYKGLHLNNRLPDLKKPLSTSDKINKEAKAMIVVGQQDYKSMQGLFYGLITDIRTNAYRHNKNLVLVCHEWTDTNEDGDIIRYGPLLSGQLRQRLAKDFDDIWHLEMFNGKEVKVQMYEDPRHIAKTRWGQIDKIGDDPDYRKILDKVKAFYKK